MNSTLQFRYFKAYALLQSFATHLPESGTTLRIFSDAFRTSAYSRQASYMLIISARNSKVKSPLEKLNLDNNKVEKPNKP